MGDEDHKVTQAAIISCLSSFHTKLWSATSHEPCDLILNKRTNVFQGLLDVVLC